MWVKSDEGRVVTINDKIVIDNDGHHPPKETEGAVQLRKGRHPIEIAFMQGGGGYEFSFAWQPPSAKQRQPLAGGVLLNNASAMIPVGIAEFQVDAAKAKKGRELFAKLRCASCHESGEEFADINSSMPLARLNSATRHGCASATPAGGLPKYDFNSQQIEALQTSLKSLQSKPKELDAAGHLHRTMTAMNCYACHQRGEVGGPSDAKSDYFVYERVVDLGDEGRLPPPLHEVGAKLTHQGFDDMLFSGQKYRTYMATRMPQFGKENIGHAVELFEKADAGKVPAREPEFSPRHVDDGRMLAGSKGLSCINCHAWGDLRLPGAEGMDLMQSSRRLKPAWFHAWLKDPQKMRPGTRMPSAWPQGQTFFKDIQGGEVDAQIDAVWAYLSVGQKAGPPPGLGSGDGKELTPTDEPIVFRTFVDQLGAHTILVGFRQRTHVAFDANLIRTRAAWTGSFITTAPVWDGRAGQYAKIPSSDIVRLPEGPAFAKLTSDAAAWPVDKPKAKIGSNRMPDGWRFKGYELDEDRIPTFLYAVGDVEVRETPGTEFLRDAAVVRRAFELSSAKAVEDFYFRAAQGEKIVADGDQFVADDNLRFRITSNGSSKPFVRTIEGRSELLVPIVLRQGKMNFSVEMKW